MPHLNYIHIFESLEEVEKFSQLLTTCLTQTQIFPVTSGAAHSSMTKWFSVWNVLDGFGLVVETDY